MLGKVRKGLCLLLVCVMLVTLVPSAAFAVEGEAVVEPLAFQTEPMIAAGNSHTVALRNDGTVWTWGGNERGQIGDGTTSQSRALVSVQNLNNVIAVAAGGNHTVALKNDGTVWTWGLNSFGQIGDDTTTTRNTPVPVQNLDNVIAVAAGASHTVALRNDGTVWAWGRGPLGDGTTTNHHTPVPVQNLDSVTAIAAGNQYSVALRNNGTVWAWGSNSSGQLGDGTNTLRHTPIPVQDLNNITAIAAGPSYTVALRSDGTVQAWGFNNRGQLGDGTTTPRRTPVPVQSLDDVIAIAAGGGFTGGTHTIALRNNGTVWAWGSNMDGQLGDSTTTDSHTPVPVQNLDNIVAVTAGGDHTVALKNDGTVWAWGLNFWGQLGNGATNRNSPVQVRGLGGVGYLNLGASGGGTQPQPGEDAATPAIIVQPQDILADHADPATLYVVAAVPRGELSFQWFSSATADITGRSPVQGATGPMFTPPRGGNSVLYYYVVVTNTDTAATGSQVASVTSRVARVVPSGRPQPPTDRITVDFWDGHFNRTTPLEINWNPQQFFVESNAIVRNNDLEIAALVLSSAAYDRRRVADTLHDLGFSRFIRQRYDVDFGEPDSVAHTFAYNPDTNTVAVVIRGTASAVDNFGNLAFIVGSPSAARNVFSGLEYFLYDLRSAGETPLNFFITGYSRGGAVAAMLSDILINQRRISTVDRTFVYTFGSALYAVPRSVQPNHMNIHNLINADDVVSTTLGLPLGRGMYGHRHTSQFTLSHRSRFRELTSVTYNPRSGLDLWMGTFILGHPHTTSAYMAILLDLRDGHTWTRPLLDAARVAMFNSPVDIEAFNSDGELVARIANNTVDTSIIGEVFAWVNEGEKQFHLPPEGEFTFRLTATGSGTMTYNIEDIALSTGETVEQKLFENVSLYNGRELLSIVGDTTATPDVRLLVVENGQPVAEVLEDGSEIPILPFADISPTYWFYPYVRNVFQRNIMQGASPTEFHPTGDFTRSMVVATLYRMVYGGPAREIPYANNRTVFSDVYAGAWYSHYVIWAYDYGIVSGVGENLFAPGQPVTRQEFAVMMHRFAGAMGHDTAVRQGPQWNSFTDLNQIATWPGAREALTWANYHGLIGGRPGPIIVPGGTAIRAEAAAILMRYVEAFGTGGTPQRPPQQPTPTALDVRALLGQNLGDVRHLLGEQLDAWEWLFFTDVSVLLLHYPEIIINVFVYYPALDVNPESRGRANVTFGSINGYSTRADVRSAFGVPYETGETENNLFYYFYFLDDIFVFFDFDRNGQLQAIHAGLFDWAA